MIESCDFCGGELTGKPLHHVYERDDGDFNMLCFDCIRTQSEVDYVKDSRAATPRSKAPDQEARDQVAAPRKGRAIQVSGVRYERGRYRGRDRSQRDVQGGTAPERAGGSLEGGFAEGALGDADLSYPNQDPEPRHDW